MGTSSSRQEGEEDEEYHYHEEILREGERHGTSSSDADEDDPARIPVEKEDEREASTDVSDRLSSSGESGPVTGSVTASSSGSDTGSISGPGFSSGSNSSNLNATGDDFSQDDKEKSENDADEVRGEPMIDDEQYESAQDDAEEEQDVQDKLTAQGSGVVDNPVLEGKEDQQSSSQEMKKTSNTYGIIDSDDDNEDEETERKSTPVGMFAPLHPAPIATPTVVKHPLPSQPVNQEEKEKCSSLPSCLPSTSGQIFVPVRGNMGKPHPVTSQTTPPLATSTPLKRKADEMEDENVLHVKKTGGLNRPFSASGDGKMNHATVLEGQVSPDEEMKIKRLFMGVDEQLPAEQEQKASSVFAAVQLTPSLPVNSSSAQVNLVDKLSVIAENENQKFEMSENNSFTGKNEDRGLEMLQCSGSKDECVSTVSPGHSVQEPMDTSSYDIQVSTESSSQQQLPTGSQVSSEICSHEKQITNPSNMECSSADFSEKQGNNVSKTIYTSSYNSSDPNKTKAANAMELSTGDPQEQHKTEGHHNTQPLSEILAHSKRVMAPTSNQNSPANTTQQSGLTATSSTRLPEKEISHQQKVATPATPQVMPHIAGRMPSPTHPTTEAAGSQEKTGPRKRPPQTEVNASIPCSSSGSSEKKQPVMPGDEFAIGLLRDGYFKFYLADSLALKICTGDIISHAAQGIVNATDAGLAHTGKLSSAIAAAAGMQMINECKNHLLMNGGSLFPSEVVETTAGGSLPSTMSHILHVVEPVWDANMGETESINKLITTYLNCFSHAEHLRIHSLAVPLIGADTFPVDIAIRGIFNAVLIYMSKQMANSSLKTLSLVITEIGLAEFVVSFLNPILEQIVFDGIDSLVAEAIHTYSDSAQLEIAQNEVNESRSQGSHHDSGQSLTNGVDSRLFRGPAVKRPRL